MPFDLPSGPWRGVWILSDGSRRKTRLWMKVNKEMFEGEGADERGSYLMAGDLDAHTGELSGLLGYEPGRDYQVEGKRHELGISLRWVGPGDSSGKLVLWPGESEKTPAGMEIFTGELSPMYTDISRIRRAAGWVILGLLAAIILLFALVISLEE